jgi:type VI secretion system protein VasG
VPPLDFAVSDPGDVQSQAASALRQGLREWSLDSILSADERTMPRLASVEVELTTAAPSRDADGDATLEELGQDLTRLASEGRVARLDLRDPIVERVLAALAAPGRSSVLLIGPRDVGKSALVGEVAARMAAGEVPPALQGRALWRLSANELIAGARSPGCGRGAPRC